MSALRTIVSLGIVIALASATWPSFKEIVITIFVGSIVIGLATLLIIRGSHE